MAAFWQQKGRGRWGGCAGGLVPSVHLVPAGSGWASWARQILQGSGDSNEQPQSPMRLLVADCAEPDVDVAASEDVSAESAHTPCM